MAGMLTQDQLSQLKAAKDMGPGFYYQTLASFGDKYGILAAGLQADDGINGSMARASL